jgi:glycosyltransferase involved in cell wall biosynthesis
VEQRSARGAVAALGSVIVPAHNEEAVILRTLEPLAPLSATGEIELVVAANGCTDRTVERARSMPGVVVLDLPTPSKTDALNAAEAACTSWPRLYVDADISIEADSVRAVLQTLRRGGCPAARPPLTYATRECSAVVRSYYRARSRLPESRAHLWGAGVYGLSRAGRARFGQFPPVTADDLYVDSLFRADEKLVVETEPVLVHVPRDARSLRRILMRTYKGNRELAALGALAPVEGTTKHVAGQLLRSVRGPRSFIDAMVYAVLVSEARFASRRSGTRWERDTSSR